MSDNKDRAVAKTVEEGEVLEKNSDCNEIGVASNIVEVGASQESVNTHASKEAGVLIVADNARCMVEKTKEENVPGDIRLDTGSKNPKTTIVEVMVGKVDNKSEKQEDLERDTKSQYEIMIDADDIFGAKEVDIENRAEVTRNLEGIFDNRENGTTRITVSDTIKETKDQSIPEKNNDNNGSISKCKKEEATNIENDTAQESKEAEASTIIDENLPLPFMQKRHIDTTEECQDLLDKWRLTEEVKTVCVALVLCLKFDVVPHDIIKTKPCAKLECWKDPFVVSPKQAIIQAGTRLEKQYEHLQLKSIKFGDEVVYQKARCYQSLDPSKEEVEQLCLSLRKRPQGERILFHYNGHGVLQPSKMGEIYVFNKGCTKYMPVSVWDLIIWLSPPIVFVFDCAVAEKVIETFEKYVNLHQRLYEVDLRQCIIHLAACGIQEVLPMHPDLPADVFTSCLTTPIKMAVHWHVVVKKSRLLHNVDLNLIQKIPGKLNDRQTILGELYWIFTAITDTIAWDVVPRELFHKLYRQDEILASLFRNYLLAERILEAHDRTPVTYPKLPCTFRHRLWDAWDHALEQSLNQLHDVVNLKKPYKHTSFFTDQLTAFERWLKFGADKSNPPQQLPILLQVLLNKTYRMRALELWVQFLDIGPWAVNLALSVGIFPYILQLLNKKTKELQEPLVFIWAKILAVDSTCQVDLILDNDCKYFITALKDHSLTTMHRTLAAFVLTSVVSNFAAGQYAALGNSLISICLEELTDDNSELKQWIAICLGKIWNKYTTARWTGVRDNAHVKLYPLLQDPCPEVRAAAVYALGTLIHSVNNVSEHADKINQAIAISLVDTVCNDMSPLVRQELVAALQWIVFTYEYKFVGLATQENNASQTSPPIHPLKRCGSSSLPVTAQNSTADFPGSPQHLRRTSSISSISGLGSPISSHVRYSSFDVKTWTALCCLEADAYPQVAQMSAAITNYIRSQINKTVSIQRRATTGVPASSSNVHIPEYEEVRRSLVTTEFVPWACKLIAQPLLKTSKPENDPESQLYHERQWTLERNTNVRTKAQEEYQCAFNCRMYSQVYVRTCVVPPTLLQFHPYEEQIAIAGQHSFAILNWDRKRQLSRFSKKSKKSKNITKLTALEWVNAHDATLVMSAYDNGSVELWRPDVTNNKSILVSAWRVYNELIPPAKLIPSDVFLSWEQWTQTVVSAGSGYIIRLWDVEQELHALDIPTGSKYPVTCLDSSYAALGSKNKNHMIFKPTEDNSKFVDQKQGLIVTGFADGCVRLYDRRCRPRDAQVITLMDHLSSILVVQLHGNNILSGCINGYVRIYDIRSRAAITTNCEPNMENLSAISIHRNADIYAWGSRDRYINIYNMFGENLNVIRFQDGSIFNSRIGSITSLAFHPHKVLLAAGTTDSAVLFYSMPRQS